MCARRRGDSKAKIGMIAMYLNPTEKAAVGRANSHLGMAAANVIHIRFVVDSPLHFPVKHNHRPTSMKAVLYQENPSISSLPEVSPRGETRGPQAPALPLPAPTPFADLVLDPEKFAAALLAAKRENDAFAASRRSPQQPAVKRLGGESGRSRGGLAANPAANGGERPGRALSANGMGPNGNTHRGGASRTELTDVEFSIEAPAAESVRLAADFTDWEKCALDMLKAPDGTWLTSVPLSPGSYAYRFIVDGEWRDDPRAAASSPNPFGTINAVKNVA